MRKMLMIGRVVLALSVVVGLCGVQGCSPFAKAAQEGGAGAVLSYFKWRFEDLSEAVDLGFTVSEKPCGGIYGTFVSIASFGWSNVDGHFIGIGGGQIGKTKYHQAGVGAMVWGYEEMGWQEFDKDDLTTIQYQGVGPIGLLMPPYGRPATAPS